MELTGRMMVEVLVAILLALSIGYLVSSYLGAKPEFQGDQALYDLGKPAQKILDHSILPWGAAPCSIRFALFIEQAPRTVAKVDCIEQDGTTPLTQFKPSCKDYEFKPCKMAGAGTCSMADNTYLSKILYHGDNLQLWCAGYTSQNDKPYVPALLQIKTGQSNDSTQQYMESVSLPAIPLQRWVIITIVKEGRRYDVYYGAKQVASKLLDRLPVPPEGGNHWAAGANGWKGKIGLVAGMKKPQSSADVLKDVEALVNTRGVPYYIDQIKLDLSFDMPECMFGACAKLPEVKPMNPFTVYATSVN